MMRDALRQWGAWSGMWRCDLRGFNALAEELVMIRCCDSGVSFKKRDRS